MNVSVQSDIDQFLLQFEVGQQVLCYVYDRYQDFTNRLLTTPPDDPLFVTYSANQFIAWKNLNSSCNWVGGSTNHIMCSTYYSEFMIACACHVY